LLGSILLENNELSIAFVLTEGCDVFLIFHRKPAAASADSRGLRIVIPYWLGWPVFVFVILWTVMNIRSGYSEWLDISNGIVGPQSWDRLHLSEIFAALGFFIVLLLATAREVITLDSVELRIRREILGVGYSRIYAVARVNRIRAGWFLDPKAGGKWNDDHVRAALYFDYLGKVHSFAHELTIKDAVEIERVFQAFPDLAWNQG
jgi:hypothetical protein